MADPDFSEPGELPTDFEIALLRDARSDAPWVVVAQRLMTLLGDRLGAQVALTVLDELHGEKISTPSRRSLLRRLARPQILEMIFDQKQRNTPDRDIAERLGVSRQAVGRVVNRSGRKLPGRRGTRRA